MPGQRVQQDKDGRVLVYVEGDQENVLGSAVTKAGGTVVAADNGRVKAAVPKDRLNDIAKQAGVREVRLPDRAIPMAVTSEGVAAAKADLWIQDGKKGAGVKVGIIDIGFDGVREAQQAGELPADAKLTVNNTNCLDTGLSKDHGTNVAEVVYDMAPEAQFYLACIDDAMGFATAAEWLRQQGVQVVTSAVGFLNPSIGRGDGTGAPDSPADVVKRSREAGILWSVAAGNQGRLHFAGTAADTSGDRWVEFSGASQNNGFPAGRNQEVTVALRWDAWPKTNEDLDLYVMKEARPPEGPNDPNIKARSIRAQAETSGGLSPTESITFTNDESGRTYYVYLKNNNARFTTKLDLFVAGGDGQLQHFTPAGSVVEPASSPYAMAVGASQPGSGALQYYSSRGPTVDGRTKPDITGFDQVSTSTYGTQEFRGTSAAAAHVAGAAAILKSAYPELDAARLEAELKSRAKGDRVDNDWGHGTLSLGTPGSKPTADPAGYTPLPDPQRIHSRPYGPGEMLTLPVPDIPSDTTAVVLNVGARSDAETRVDVLPSDPEQSATKTSTLQVRPGGGFTAVMTVATLGKDRAIRLRNHTGNSWLVVDILGYFSKDGTSTYFAKPSPERVLDTRVPPTAIPESRSADNPRQGHLTAGETMPLKVRGVAGVPANATAVAVNITGLEATGETFITATGQTFGASTTLNLRRNDRRSNLAIVGIAENGTIKLRNESGEVNVLVDVVGWFAPGQGAKYVALTTPARIADTGTGTGVPGRPIGAGDTASVQVGGLAGVSSSASAAVLTVTGAEDRVGTELSVAPTELGHTPVTNVSVGQRESAAGSVFAPLGASGRLGIRNERGQAQATVDVQGYFTGASLVTGGDGCALATGETGFTSLFDGRTETGPQGWQQTENGRLTQEGCEWVTSGTGVRWNSAATYSNDYTLRLDWKATSTQADSGVFVGFNHPAGNGAVPINRGLEVQIAQNVTSGDRATGAIAGKRAPDVAAAKPVGEWNSYEITLSWNKVTVVLNGQKVNEYTTIEPDRINPQSFIGLQTNGPNDPVRFRNIRIKSNAATGVGPFVGLNNKCLDVAGGNPDNGTVLLYGCWGSNNRAQTWTLPGDGTVRAYSKCVDVRDGNTAAGTPIQLVECTGVDAQQWIVRADGSMVNNRSGKCLNATGSVDGSTLTIDNCSGQPQQVWRPSLRAATIGALALVGDKCLDVAGGRPGSGSVIVYPCHGDAPQAWSIVDNGSVRAFGKCLDVSNSATPAGTKVILFDCNGGEAQKWLQRPDGGLVNPHSQRCLTAASAEPGAELTIEDCVGRALQRWHFSAQAVSKGAIVGITDGETDGKCLDVAGSNPAAGQVIMYWCNGGNAQHWTRLGDGTIRAYDRCLDVAGSGTGNGTPVTLYPCNGGNAQQWVRRPDGTLTNPLSDKCLDAGRNGLVIQQCSGAANQRWAIAARPS
ncbi:ricin-type beta-trefoil lectin domain protein [Amycolatopsis sp. cmx-11-12]|uniref:ricin-type beta-trefoil lectin domain protein n=1 Tax=Amycolatopsis sp. cmx-11-12 TaxID=2785795 RepID=UPI0039180635